MAWTLHITGPAQKEFQKLPAKDQARVKNALLAMQQDPFSGECPRYTIYGYVAFISSR